MFWRLGNHWKCFFFVITLLLSSKPYIMYRAQMITLCWSHFIHFPVSLLVTLGCLHLHTDAHRLATACTKCHARLFYSNFNPYHRFLMDLTVLILWLSLCYVLKSNCNFACNLNFVFIIGAVYGLSIQALKWGRKEKEWHHHGVIIGSAVSVCRHCAPYKHWRKLC